MITETQQDNAQQGTSNTHFFFPTPEALALNAEEFDEFILKFNEFSIGHPSLQAWTKLYVKTDASVIETPAIELISTVIGKVRATQAAYSTAFTAGMVFALNVLNSNQNVYQAQNQAQTSPAPKIEIEPDFGC